MSIALRSTYETFIQNCIDRQCGQTKSHIDAYRMQFALNRHSSGYSDSWKQIIFALVANKAHGAFVYDKDGNEYLDLTMGFGVHLFGHSPSFILEAIREQLDQLSSLGPVSTLAGETAALLCKMTANERCVFFNSGTEAVMVALRLARAATGKNKIVIFEGGYHGTHDSLLTMNANPVTMEAIGNIPGIPPSMVADTILLSFGSQASIEFIMKNSDEIAAILTEPVQSRHPGKYDPEFLRRLDALAREKNICFILDEVITGFRVSNGGMKCDLKLQPGITIYGKIAGGGMPLGIVAGDKRFLDYIDGGEWRFTDESKPVSPTTFVAGTFCQHPLTMAAAKATLLYLENNQGSIQEELTQNTKWLADSINEFCITHHLPVSISHYSSLFRFQLKGRNRILFYSLLKEKIYIWEGRTCFLSTSHGKRELEQVVRSIKKCLLEMKAAGYFPMSVNKEKPGEINYVQAGLEINNLLEENKLQFVFNYVVACVADINGVELETDYQKTREQNSHEADVKFYLELDENRTRLKFYFNRTHFDGWSIQLFLHFMSDCYAALEKNLPLPACDFTPRKEFVSWLNGTTISRKPSTWFKANTMEQTISLNELKIEEPVFDKLLARFGQSLGTGKHHIGVPVSGQLISRKLKTVGNCTCQVPVMLQVDDEVNQEQLVGRIREEMKKVKTGFKIYFGAGSHSAFPIAFNLDRTGETFSFAGRETSWLNTAEEETAHDLFMNVVATPFSLHISLKYRDEFPPDRAGYIFKKFISLIANG